MKVKVIQENSKTTGNRPSSTTKISYNQSTNFPSKQKKIFISRLNVTEFENLSTLNNQTLENYLTTVTLNSHHRTESKNVPNNFSKNKKSKPTSSTERISILKEQNKSRLVDRKIEDKKLQQEIESLISEQSRLKKSLDKTKDQLALSLVSRKILEISGRLKKIMNSIKIRNRNENDIDTESDRDSVKGMSVGVEMSMGMTESQKSKKSKSKSKFFLSNCTTYRTDWAVTNKKKIKINLEKSKSDFIESKYGKTEMNLNDSFRSAIDNKHGLESGNNSLTVDKYEKMHDDNLKIRQIFLDNKLIEQKNKISHGNLLMHNDSIKTYPNFFFLRKNKIATEAGVSKRSQYVPSTNIENGVNLFSKSYRPEGFRHKAKTNTNINKGNNPKKESKGEIPREKIFLNYNLTTEIPNHNPKRNVQDIIEENDKTNLLINNKEILEAILRNKRQKPRTAFITSTKSVRPAIVPISKASQRLRPHSSSLLNFKNEENFSLNSEMKNLRKIYTQVITDHKVIKHSVKENYRMKKRKYKESDYDNLLKLWEMNQLEGHDEKNLKNRRDHDEKKNNYLNTFTGTNRKFLNEVYKQVEYENRVLSKLNGYETNKQEDKVAQQKMHKEFRKIARETMYMKREYFGDEQDFEIKKQFEHHYSNLDQLQWLVKKKKVFQNIKPRFLNRNKE